LLPGAALVNAIPIMQYLPSWFPGAGFQKIAADSREVTRQMKEVPFKWAENNIIAGLSSDCLVASLLPSCKTKEDIVTVQEFAAIVYAAGADTTTSALETFFYAMAISGDVQRKAQQEIDTVVGRDRLPNYDDWPYLPYTEALLREILRWRPVAPLTAAHCTTEDDVFNGYLMPKGAFIMVNIWAISRDKDRYKDPEAFNPGRFIDESGQLNDDDSGYIFGFGRRICPGRHMARSTLWLSMVTTLWAFNISRAKDDSGNEIQISGDYTDGLISHPHRHACSIVPRFLDVEKLVNEAFLQAKDTRT
jgi:cytochrome P450